jgi:large subunit ribosomal protein L4
METTLYKQDGKSAGKFELPKGIFDLPWNSDVVNQVINSLRQSARGATQHTKDRAEVSGGGKKPWQQKGLGKARAGSSRSPIWVKGGVSHGPRNEKNTDRKVNKKLKAKAVNIMLSKKFKNGEVLFVENVTFAKPKTVDAKKVLASFATIKGFEKLAIKKVNAMYLALPTKDENVLKSFNNFGNVAVEELRNINPLVLAQYKYIVITNPAVSLPALAPKTK